MLKRLLLSLLVTVSLFAIPASAEFGETHKLVYWERYGYGSGYQVRLHNRTGYPVGCYLSFEYGDKNLYVVVPAFGASIYLFTPVAASRFSYNCNPIY